MMSPRVRRRRSQAAFMAVLAAVISSTVPARAGIEASQLPRSSSNQVRQEITSLPAVAQGTISATLGRDNPTYQVKRSNAGYEAANAHHNLNASFTRAGVTFRSDGDTWTVALKGWGYGSNLRPASAASPAAKANRVEYARGPMTEWYENGPLGLEQGFTLNQRPAGSRGKANSDLTVALALSGDLTATADADRAGLTLASRDGRARLRYAGLNASDADGRTLQARLEVKGNRLLLRVDDHAARYPVTIDPWVQEAELNSSDGVAGDEFGIGVAISGDTVVVGAWHAAVGSNPNQGAVYVFQISGGTATQVAKLTASDGAAWNQFGPAVAIDGNTIVVGASDVNNQQGAAYVFVEPQGGWTNMNETAKLIASDGVSFDLFGYSVGVSGNTVVVGAACNPYNSITSTAGPGAAYVYVEPSGGWSGTASNPTTETAKLTASDGAAGDDFGAATAISGNAIVVGAFSAAVSNPQQGAAYVYVEPTGGWAGTAANPTNETAKLIASDGKDFDNLGYQVGIDGNTVVAGAPGATINSTNGGQGAAYVFVAPTNGWSGTALNPTNETAKLIASDGVADDSLGHSVDISGETISVGATLAPFNATSSTAGPGAAYIYVEPSGGWSGTASNPTTETEKLTASNGAAGDEFGVSVGISAESIVVGAFYATYDSSTDTPGPGAAYVFESQGAAQTITFPAVQTPVYATQDVTLSASVNSGLEVTFTSQTTSVCTIETGSTSLSGDTTTATANLLTSGICTIQATQPGDSSWSAATPVTKSFTVTAEPQTITFNNPGAQIVGTQLPLTASASSGLAVSFNSQTQNYCTVDTNNVASFIAIGNCTIQATQAGDSTYAAATAVTQTFAVTGEPQTITFNNPGAQIVGTQLPLTASASSGLAVSFNSQSMNYCTVNTNNIASFIAIGTCTIQATQAGDSTYAAATAVTRTFAVTGEPQTITFNNPGAQIVGTQLPLTASASSGLAVSFNSQSMNYCTVNTNNIASFIATGTCTIQATQTGNSTYAAATAVTQSFAVTGFTVSASPTTVAVPQSETGTSTITITDVEGFSGTVALSASNLPSGVTASFAAGSMAGTQVLTLSASTSAAITTSPVTVTITGTSGSLTETASIALSITPEPTFTAGPGGTTSITVAPGATTRNTGTISVVGMNGFSGAVNLTCTVTTALTDGQDAPTCSLNPSSVTISGSTAETSTLTATTDGPNTSENRMKNPFGPGTGGALLALLCFFIVPRRRWNRLVILILAAICSIGAISCGGSGIAGTTAGTYTITVTGTSGSLNATVGTITLTVQ